MGSTRFPGKVLKEVLGKPLLGHLVERLLRARSLDDVVLAIPESPVNDPLAEIGLAFGAQIVRGSELDVLDRYAKAADFFPAEAYLRVTGDCPLVCPELVDQLVQDFWAESLEYARTGLSFPDGLDLEVFSKKLLIEASTFARENYEREHVTPFMQKKMDSRTKITEFARDLSQIRLTIDEPEDLEVVSSVLTHFGHNMFGFSEIENLVSASPELFEGNQSFARNEGSEISSGAKLWRRAKKIIPGGSMLFSKKAELFSNKKWPTYFSRAQGCKVWDLDNNSFLDVGYMGIGTNILGYGHPAVDEAVMGVIGSGNMTTLNAPEEVELAESLCGIHAWANMAKFTRSGGEACAVAIRIARAHSGKSGVAICGYHGWHDWYLSANIFEGNALDQHLIPGLGSAGIPPSLSGLVMPFRYNDLDGLEEILCRGDTGTVFMETQRNVEPAPGFLAGVRKLADKYGAVLVFDECTSGFRQVLGGMHLIYGVQPDMLILGKTLGNGYAINAVVGTGKVMASAEATFISSTFWTERIGPAAALASLSAMKSEDAPSRVHAIGLQVRAGWEDAATSAGLDIVISGLPALSTYIIEGYEPAEVKTYVVEKMIDRGYLSPPAFYASVSHTPEVVNSYLNELGSVFLELANIQPRDLARFLPHGVAQSGFRRMN